MLALDVEAAKQIGLAIAAGAVILAVLTAIFVRAVLAKAVVILILGGLVAITISQRANISTCATRIEKDYRIGSGGPMTCKFLGRKFTVTIPTTVPTGSN